MPLLSKKKTRRIKEFYDSKIMIVACKGMQCTTASVDIVGFSFYDYYLLLCCCGHKAPDKLVRLSHARTKQPTPERAKRIDPTRVTVGYELNRKPKNING